MTATEARLFAWTTHDLMDYIRNETVLDDEADRLLDEGDEFIDECRRSLVELSGD